MPHFGAALTVETFHKLAARLKEKDVKVSALFDCLFLSYFVCYVYMFAYLCACCSVCTAALTCTPQFIIEPHIRFVGLAGEQWTMFFKDPCGNNLEFKAMTNPAYLFQKQ